MPQVTIEEAQAHLGELIEAAMKGESVVIAKDEKTAVQLTPVNESKPRRKAGSAKGMIHISEDFDDPLPEFEPHTG